jgi:hypothetical protein
MYIELINLIIWIFCGVLVIVNSVKYRHKEVSLIQFVLMWIVLLCQLIEDVVSKYIH